MRYPGGKGVVFRRIINLMPPHSVYIETHGGAGAVIRNKKPAEVNVILEVSQTAYIGLKTACEGLDKGIIVTNTDAHFYLKTLSIIEPTVIYCDPPYLKKTRSCQKPIYECDYTEAQHVELLNILKGLGESKNCHILVSGYYSDLYAEALSGWNSINFNSMTRGGSRREWVWFNYDPPKRLHEYTFIGDSFRERERIVRRRARWISNLKKMPVLERRALIEQIEATFA